MTYDTQLKEIHKLMLLIKGVRTRYWVIDENTGKEVLFQYPQGTVENWKKRLNELITKRYQNAR
jgi:hypothetical protein